MRHTQSPYYGCKHRRMDKGHKCNHKKQIPCDLLDSAFAEIIIKLISKPSFAALMQKKINLQIDTSSIQQEIDHYEKTLRQQYAVKVNLAEEIDSLDPDDKYYRQRKLDLDERFYRMYDKIQETESALIECKAKKQAIEADKITSDNIYRILTSFDQLYAIISDAEKRELLETLISEIQVYPDQKPSGQWIESIGFRLPIIENNFEMSLDKLNGLETVMLFEKA